MHVLLASLFVQVFALVTPLFFQVVVDKVLSHKGYSTLIVLTIGIVLVGLFDVVLQYLRTYALTHTTNRIDVELGQRLFRHLLHLPLSYFETRAAGQTVARVRELEKRARLPDRPGPVLGARPRLHDRVHRGAVRLFLEAQHHRGAVHPALHAGGAGIPAGPSGDGPREVQRPARSASSSWSRPSSASRPSRPRRSSRIMQQQWEERLAAYVKQSFSATIVSAIAQNGIAYISRLTTALLDAVRRQGGDRRRIVGRRARRLQHDLGPGDGAGAAPVPALPGLPAGADLDRAPGRRVERPGRTRHPGPHRAAPAARADRVPQRVLSATAPAWATW